MNLEVKGNTLIVPEGTKYINAKNLYEANIDFRGIKKIILPSTFKRITQQVFEDFKNLEEINFPDSLISIEDQAFCCSNSLKNIELNEGLKLLDLTAFDCCDLEKLYIPSTVELITPGILEKCTQITVSKDNSVYSDCGCNVIYDKETKTVIQGCKTSKIPEEAERIEYDAFWGLDIKQLVIPKNIKYIGKSAFNDMHELEKVIAMCPSSALSDCTFSCCYNIKEIYLLDTNVDEKSDFYYVNKNKIKFLDLDTLISSGMSFNQLPIS